MHEWKESVTGKDYRHIKILFYEDYHFYGMV